MIQITFTPEAIQALNDERYHHPHPRVQRKMEAVWLKSQGIPHKEIARLTSVSINTVTNYLRTYQQSGLDGLKHISFYQPQSQLHKDRSTLESYFREHPPATIKEASHTIEELTGLKRGETQVRAFLKSMGLSRRKVGMIPAKADVQQQEEFKKKTWSLVWMKPRLGKEPSFSSMPRILCLHRF